MKRKSLFLFVLDIYIVAIAGACILYLKYDGSFAEIEKYLKPFLCFLVCWLGISILYKKYKASHVTPKKLFQRIISSNFLILALVIIFMYGIRRQEYSRLVVFGIIVLATIIELITWSFMNKIKSRTSEMEDFYDILTEERIDAPVTTTTTTKEVPHFRKQIIYSLENVKSYIVGDKGEKVFRFIAGYIDPASSKTLVVNTTTKFNIDNQPGGFFHNIVNLKRINDIRYINKFFESVNAKLPLNGMFVGCAETKDQRKKRILLKYPKGINYLFYSIDFVVKRIFPKFPYTKKIYFFLTRGQNRVLSRAEILGRLISCGFDIIVEERIDKNFYWVARKKGLPHFDMDPTYGMFVRLPRLGKNGKMIKVFKFRTMHPYSEYLQNYVYSKNDLAEGGKFNNDFRVSNFGKFLRTFWLDELPMFINFIRGELKLVGVRPISLHYFSLYTKELQDKRLRYKPGLIPPFYADLPKTLDEIMASEMKYLEAYDKHPLVTDWKYLWRAVFNIAFRKARSN